MAKITINDKEYDTDDMSENGLAQMHSFQFATAELQRLEALAAAMQTAASAYARALNTELEIKSDGE